MNESGAVRYGNGADARKIRRFAIRDRARYAEGMTDATAALLARFPIQRD